MALKIPEIPARLTKPVQSLADAASLVQGVIAQVVEGRPIKQILNEQGDYLMLACRVIDLWSAHLSARKGDRTLGG
jgi:hypothetical protein